MWSCFAFLCHRLARHLLRGTLAHPTRIQPFGRGFAITAKQYIALGLALPVWAFTLFQRESTELNPTSETNRKLVISGPYAISRNPMYLGLTIISLGLAFWVGSLPMFAVPLLVFVVANWVHIPFEEAKMRRQFGTQFDDYTHKVRRWI